MFAKIFAKTRKNSFVTAHVRARCLFARGYLKFVIKLSKTYFGDLYQMFGLKKIGPLFGMHVQR